VYFEWPESDGENGISALSTDTGVVAFGSPVSVHSGRIRSRNKTNRNPLLTAKHMPNHNREPRKPANGGHVFVADPNHRKKPK
jgi:hypothetical protein